MKTIEEKAKAYDEAIKRAKAMIKVAANQDESIGFANTIFPELNESEDEKIRKWLIDTIKSVPNDSIEWDVINKSDVLAWLEKQGEQKSTDTCDSSTINGKEFPASEKRDFGYFIKSKFHEGDWVILTAGELSTILQIVKVATNKKLYWFDDSSYLPIVDEECLRLWSIQDAKDGDVLACDDGFVMIVKELKCSEWGWRLTRHCALLLDGTFTIGEVHTKVNGLHPATKDQRDLLFQKMKEAGYEWDTEKKKLSKRVIDEGKSEIDYCFTKMMNGEKVNPIWSEDDERMLNDAIGAVDTTDYYTYDDKQEIENWLESLKKRTGG